ncbi:MAG: FAD-dependent oxidoreductase [Clostridium sp.]|nr:FAD-dependent oxidoreductase [Clostridium sp.]
MLRINQIKIPVTAIDASDKPKEQKLLMEKLERMLGTREYTLAGIVKKSIDARKKETLAYSYSVEISSKHEHQILNKNRNNNNIMSTKRQEYHFPVEKTGKEMRSPIIVGAGPAGYFCGLYLARAGYQPIILERGKCVSRREEDVTGFWQGEAVNPESNVSFGEGGAGTFSDGKLNTGIKDKEGRIQAVVKDFIKYGAPCDIGYVSKPHIGTDYLKGIMEAMRADMISMGGRVLFETRFEGYEEGNGHIRVKAKCLNKSAEQEYIYFDTDALVLAIGHSARDTFHALHAAKLAMEPKAFAVGLRIEHLRSTINQAQYGDSDAAKRLPAADYKLTYRSSEGRSVYSFCMCPGGFVVNASSGEEQSVVNGMSSHSRNEINSNSAIVVNVTPEDFDKEGFSEYGVLAGVKFQQKYEALAYREGKGSIPVQLFGDYKAGRLSHIFGKIKPNIKGSYAFGNLNNCLPAFVNNAIIEGIDYYGERLAGFNDKEAVLSGIETRTSSPVRLVRGEDFMSVNVHGIFPCGEGAGYAGGITSAAVDGIKAAEAVAGYLNQLD